MDHLFHKNILQEKSNLEWQLAEANAKIEKLQRTLSSLKEAQVGTGNPGGPGEAPTNAPGYDDPVETEDGTWYSRKPMKPTKPLHPHTPFIAPWMDDDWMPPWAYPPGTQFPPPTGREITAARKKS